MKSKMREGLDLRFRLSESLIGWGLLGIVGILGVQPTHPWHRPGSSPGLARGSRKS